MNKPRSFHDDTRGSKYAALALLFAILGAVFLGGCGHRSVGQVLDVLGDLTKPTTGTTTPPTTPVTAPTPCVPACVGENQTGCKVEPSPGVCKHVCSSPWVASGITLVDQPADCPAPPTTPDPPVEPPATMGVEIVPGSDWQIQPRTTAPHVNAVNAAMLAEVGDRGLDCAIGNGCALPMGGEQAFIRAVIARLRAAGLGAGQHEPNQDKVAVGTQNDNWTYHCVGYGKPDEGRPPTVAWQPNRAEPSDHWIATGPTPGPSPTDVACLSLSRIVLDVQDGKARRHINATPQHQGREECAAFGHRADRDFCPLGMEGDPRRAECEAKHKPYTWTVTPDPGWELAPEQDGQPNPLVIRLEARRAGTVKVCSVENTCGSLVVQ